MSLRKLGAALSVVLVSLVVGVSSASATATTTGAQWYTGSSPGTTLPVGTQKPFTGKIGGGTNWVIRVPLGTNQVLTKITANQVECLGCVIENLVASRSGVNTSSSVVAVATGALTLKGAIVDEPSGCSVESASGVATEITTNPLTWHFDFMEGETALASIFPKSGETFATFKLTGATCSVAGTYLIKGSLFSAEANKTGVQAAEQPNNFSPTINSNAGGELKVGSKKAEITGTGIFGLETKEAFGIH